MACGVHLGIFWILCRIFLCRIFMLFLVSSEHLCCLASYSQAQNGKMYARLLQPDDGLRRPGGKGYLQNQFRQASLTSAQSGNLNMGTGYGQGISSSGQPVSQLVRSYPLVRSLQTSSVSNPTWSKTNSNQFAAKESQKNEFGLSTDIASGSALSQRFGRKKQNRFTSRSRAPSPQQVRPRISQYQSRPSEAPVYDRSSAMLAQKQGQKSLIPMTSKMFAPIPPGPIVRNPFRMQTSASAPAKRVTASSKKASSFSRSQNERTPFNPGQANVGKTFRSRLFPATEGSYKSNSNRASNYKQTFLQPCGPGAPAPAFYPTQTHRIPWKFGGAAIRRLKEPVQENVSSQEPQQTRLRSFRPLLRL